MKRKTLIMLVALATIVGALGVVAATQRWSYDTAPLINCIIADGSGGCGYVRLDTNEFPSVIWLDKKGAPIYRADLTTNLSARIVSCTKKQLVYAAFQDSWRYVQVARDGTATPISVTNSNTETPYLMQMIPISFTTDAKGFFAVRVNLPDGTMSLVRFDNK